MKPARKLIPLLCERSAKTPESTLVFRKPSQSGAAKRLIRNDQEKAIVAFHKELFSERQQFSMSVIASIASTIE